MVRRLTAILAADVDGYSRLTRENEEKATARLRDYIAVLKKLIAAHNGRIKTYAGDAVLAEFPSVVEAVRCAIEIQNEISGLNAPIPKNEQMQFRIGVNLTDAIAVASDVYGTGVNVAARLAQEKIQPGLIARLVSRLFSGDPAASTGIFVSEIVYNHLSTIQTPQQIPFAPVGLRPHYFKNIPDPVRVYTVLKTPPSKYKEAAWRWADRLGRTEFAAPVFLLFFAVAAGTSYYLRQPADLWSTLLSEAPEGTTIAVRPFVDKGNSPAEKTFSSGLSDDIMTELSRLRDLSVVEYRGKAADVRDIGRELKARYILEGTVSPSGGDLFYIRPKLKDTQTGHTIWSKRFDRDMAKRSLVDDEIACQIAAKIAGGYGVIESTEVKSAKRKSSAELQADELVAKARGMMQWEWTEDNFVVARKLLHQALKLDPNSGPARREMAWYDLMGAVFSIDAQPVSLEKITADALDAVKLEPDDGRARMVAASAYFFAKQLKLFDYEATQAIKDAPCDPEILAVLGALLGNSGQWSRAVRLVEKANALNAEAAVGWYQSTVYLNDYLHGDYESALDMIRQSPDFQNGVEYAYFDYLSICGQLGRKQGVLEKPQSGGDTECKPSAEEAWRKILEDDPGATAKTFEDWYRKWNFRDEDIAKLMDGANKAGVFGPETKARPLAVEDHHTESGAAQ
jgi:adenylate cyclase